MSPVLFIDDVISEMLQLNPYVAPVKNDAYQKIMNKLLGTEILVQKKQADAELPFVFIEEVIADLRANIDIYVGPAGKTEFERILQTMQLKRLVRKRTENQNSNREEFGAEVDRTRFVAIDPPKEERPDNYDEVVMVVDEMQNNSPYAKQELVEVDEQPTVPEPVQVEPVDAAMQLNGSISDENPGQIDSESNGSYGEDGEEPLSDDSESSEDPPQKKLTRRSSAISIPVKTKSKLSHAELQARRLNSRSSHGQLIGIIMDPKNRLKDPANAALLLKQEHHLLDIIVEAIDKPAQFSVHKREDVRSCRRDAIKQQVFLNDGDEYGDDLARLIATLLGSYEVSKACLHFETLVFGDRERGVAIPFENYFEPRSNKINISSLCLNNCELASLLEFVRPMELYLRMPSTFLLGIDYKLINNDIPYIELDGSHKDDVDRLMEQWRSGYIVLGENCAWSDYCFKKVLTMWANDGGAPSVRVDCHACRNPSYSHQRTTVEWKTLFNDWRSSQAVPNSIKFQTHVSEEIVIFSVN